jgi:hypothetical protein
MNQETIEEIEQKLQVFEGDQLSRDDSYIDHTKKIQDLETKLIELTQIVKHTQQMVQSQDLNQVETLVSDIATNIDQGQYELEQAHIMSGMMTYVTLGAMAGGLAGTLVGIFPGIVLGSASGFIYWLKK